MQGGHWRTDLSEDKNFLLTGCVQLLFGLHASLVHFLLSHLSCTNDLVEAPYFSVL